MVRLHRYLGKPKDRGVAGNVCLTPCERSFAIIERPNWLQEVQTGGAAVVQIS
jgi:hypothetical protein